MTTLRTWNWWRLRWEPRTSASDWAFAAHHDGQADLLRAETLRQQAARHGFDVDIRDSYRLSSPTNGFEREEISAWKLGARMAASVRRDTGMNGGPVDDAKLLQFMAVKSGALEEAATGSRIAFLLDQDGSEFRRSHPG